MWKFLKRLRSDRRGNALVIGAATLPLVIGAAAIGVDTIQVSVARRQLQRAADSAALAGVRALVQEKDVAAAATYDLTLNDDVTLSATPTIENAPTVGPYAGRTEAVRVVLAAERSVPFISFFTGDTIGIQVEATAATIVSGEYCMVSLEEEEEIGIDMGGNAVVDLGCGMITNSPASNAVNAYGSAVIEADPVAAVGEVPPATNYASGTHLLEHQSPYEDPFEDLPDPVVPSGCNNQLSVQPNNSYTVTVGEAVSNPPSALGDLGGANVYCYRGMDIKGTVTLQPGIYILDGGSFNVNSQGVVNGSGVTFILTGNNANTIANLSINGSATLNLTAPDTSVYAGVLFYQDRRANFGTTHINGNSSSLYRGAFYFPERELILNGTAGMQIQCVQMVGRRLGFTGNSSISNTCPTGSSSGGFDITWVRLVG